MSGGISAPNPIRVVELIKALDPGGAESLLVARLAHADQDRFDYRVACLDPSRQEWLPELRRRGLPLVPISASGRWDWRWVRDLRRYLITERIDVIHTHSPLAAVGVRLAVRSIHGGRPASITTEHTERMNRATQIADATTAPLDDLVIAVSEATKNAPVCRKARRTEVVDHGVDLDRIRRARVDRQTLRQMFGMRTPSVVAVANFRTAKGHDDLLEVAELVHSVDSDVHFYVAGQGPLEGWVRQQVADRGMEWYFHVVGTLPEAVRLTIAGDIFALTSRWEGRSVAVMEALAAETPVVAFSVGGTPEMITDGLDGFLIPPRDTRLFAQRLLELVHDPDTAAKVGREARASSTRYDISLASRRIEDLYEELARARTLSRR